MTEYIAIVDHTSEANKSFSYVHLENNNKAFACAEGARKGFKLDNVYCVHIAKKIKKNTYRSICLVYPGGMVRDTNSVGDIWFDHNFYVSNSDFEKKTQRV